MRGQVRSVEKCDCSKEIIWSADLYREQSEDVSRYGHIQGLIVFWLFSALFWFPKHRTDIEPDET